MSNPAASWTAARQASLSTISQNWLKFMSIEELAQVHVHWVSDAIQPSHSLSPPSPALNLSRHQGFFPVSLFLPSGGQSIGVSASASVLLMNTQDWSPLGWTGWISFKSKGLSRVFSTTTQFKSINSSALSFLHSPTLTSIHDYWKNHSFDYTDLCW